MRTLRFILQKEFKQIFRDKSILILILILPFMQLGILPLAMNFDVKNINLVIVDQDHSSVSIKMIHKIGASRYFNIIALESSYQQAFEWIEENKADIILEIPNNFEKDLVNENFTKINLSMDAINGTKSSIGSMNLIAVITDYNKDIQIFKNQEPVSLSTIDIATSLWYNPFSNYYWFIVPGILAFLLTVFAGSISTMNIVKEKEIGTIEQINVTPIKKWQFVLGKLIPFWVIGMIIMTLGLWVSILFYGIHPLGSIALLYALSGLYMVALLGFGLFVATISNNQLQAMFISFFFVMIFVLMSGLFTPIESMPAWARKISAALPITYFMKAIRMLVLKGSTFADLKEIFLILTAFAIGLNGLAIWNYKKTS